MVVMERDLSGTPSVDANLADAPPEEIRRRQAAMRARKLRSRNLAVLFALLALVALFYAITVVRMSAGH
ncbi:hypothetical protein [Azospirillum picis]|uniref:Fatty acid desaturase n=1 Tax=Azospirillum picis TaxID=488438 RepID=A0ABU0MTR5_9PROT|nr:hypothetical protein [Azospirillum picis]MBP2303133.1 fatty acid desaturase [Azospirillum picis]MDQ0536885.1 fatty acid desaturase [Azospirillum picis]